MERFNKFLVVVLAVAFALGLTGSTTVLAAGPLTVDLKTAAPFAVLAGSEITNVPTSVITGNLGLSPAAGSFYGSGVTQDQVTGTIYSVNAAGPSGYVENKTLVDQAQLDLTAAYDDAAGRTSVATTLDSPELGGRTLTAGVYTTGSTALGITGTLTLDGQDDPTSVFIFEGADAEAGALTVNPGGTVSLINGACASNVFWRVYGATINTSAVFKGNILALTSITVAGGVGTESNIEGRLLARNANVTLDHTTVSVPTTCTVSDTAAATAAAAAAAKAAAAVKLPSTGIAPTHSNTPLNIAIVTVVFALSISFVLVRRKKRAI